MGATAPQSPPATTPKRPSTTTTHIPPTLSQTYPSLQYSVHTPPRSLLYDLCTIFPDLRSHPSPLTPLLIPTFQRARLNLVQFGDAEQQEKDRLLATFLQWARSVRAHILDRGGAWADVTDPVTGCAYFGTGGGPYSDVEGVVRVLSYPTHEVGGCRIVKHPHWGFAAYPATLFTTANLDIVMQALNAVNAEDGVKVDDAVSKQGVI